MLAPQRGRGTAFTQTDAADLSGALGDLGSVILPATLAGRPRLATPIGFGQVGIYGRGLATFAVLQITGITGLRLISAARYDGGTSLKVRHGTGVVVSTPADHRCPAAPQGRGRARSCWPASWTASC